MQLLNKLFFVALKIITWNARTGWSQLKWLPFRALLLDLLLLDLLLFDFNGMVLNSIIFYVGIMRVK
jgi:hypothetical protein